MAALKKPGVSGVIIEDNIEATFSKVTQPVKVVDMTGVTGDKYIKTSL